MALGGPGSVCQGLWGALGRGLQLREVDQGVALDAPWGCWASRGRVSEEPPQRNGTSLATGVPGRGATSGILSDSYGQEKMMVTQYFPCVTALSPRLLSEQRCPPILCSHLCRAELPWDAAGAAHLVHGQSWQLRLLHPRCPGGPQPACTAPVPGRAGHWPAGCQLGRQSTHKTLSS